MNHDLLLPIPLLSSILWQPHSACCTSSSCSLECYDGSLSFPCPRIGYSFTLKGAGCGVSHLPPALCCTSSIPIIHGLKDSNSLMRWENHFRSSSLRTLEHPWCSPACSQDRGSTRRRQAEKAPSCIH